MKKLLTFLGSLFYFSTVLAQPGPVPIYPPVSQLIAGGGITLSPTNGRGTVTITAAGAGTGNVTGPGSSTTNGIATFGNTSGELLASPAWTLVSNTLTSPNGGTLVDNGTGQFTFTSAANVNGNFYLVPGSAGDFAGLTLNNRASGANAASRSWQIAPNYFNNGSLDFIQSATVGGAATTQRMELSALGNLLIGGTTDITGTGNARIFGGFLQLGAGTAATNLAWTNTAANTIAWETSVRQDVGTAADDWKLLRYAAGSFSSIPLYVTAAAGNVIINTTTDSGGPTSGSLQTLGGAAIQKNVTIGTSAAGSVGSLVIQMDHINKDAVSIIDNNATGGRNWVFGTNTGNLHSFTFRDGTGSTSVLQLNDGASGSPYSVLTLGTSDTAGVGTGSLQNAGGFYNAKSIQAGTNIFAMSGSFFGPILDTNSTASMFLKVNNSTVLTLANGGAATFAGTVTPTGGIIASTSGTAPVATLVGNLLTGTGSATALTTATPVNITSATVTLTAGNWIVTGSVVYANTSATASIQESSISTTTGTQDTTVGRFCQTPFTSTILSSTITHTLPTRYMTVSTSTPVFLVAQESFTAGSATANGVLQAQRY